LGGVDTRRRNRTSRQRTEGAFCRPSGARLRRHDRSRGTGNHEWAWGAHG